MGDPPRGGRSSRHEFFLVGRYLPLRDAVCGVAGVRDCNVELVFDPPWDQSRMSDEAKLAVGMF